MPYSSIQSQIDVSFIWTITQRQKRLFQQYQDEKQAEKNKNDQSSDEWTNKDTTGCLGCLGFILCLSLIPLTPNISFFLFDVFELLYNAIMAIPFIIPLFWLLVRQEYNNWLKKSCPLKLT